MNEEYFVYNPCETAPEANQFSVQRQIISRAKELGWCGNVPLVLGTYFADQQVRMAALFIGDCERSMSREKDAS